MATQSNRTALIVIGNRVMLDGAELDRFRTVEAAFDAISTGSFDYLLGGR